MDGKQCNTSNKFTINENIDHTFDGNTSPTQIYTGGEVSDAIGNTNKVKNDAVVGMIRDVEEAVEELTILHYAGDAVVTKRQLTDLESTKSIQNDVEGKFQYFMFQYVNTYKNMLKGVRVCSFML